MNEKQQFLKQVTILCDTREQKNQHIIEQFDRLQVQHESRKLDIGDYTFVIENRDFSLSCVLERKATINELWTNITKDRMRFEKELAAASNVIHSTSLLIERCNDWDALRSYQVSHDEMQYQNRKIQDIGRYIFDTLQAWSSPNRYGFTVCFSECPEKTAGHILNTFYWYWHNYKQLIKPLRKEKTA